MRAKGIAVDRKYYLKSLHTPLTAMFLPIVRQMRVLAAAADINDPKITLTETERMLFDITKHRPWRQDAALRGACIANSPLVMAFAVQRARAEQPSSAKKQKP